MRCEEVRQTLLEDWSQDVTESTRTHLSGCPECRLYARDLGFLRGGFLALASEPAPEPSWGFAERLLRRLEVGAATQTVAEEFFERVGRRVVYAAGTLALMLILVLAVPSSGPLRDATAAELYWAQSDVASVGNDAGFSDESLDSSDVAQAPTATEESETGNKP